MLARQGYRVGIVDLTDGEPTPGSPGPEVRLAEARRAAEVLGAATRITLDLPNRRLFDTFEARVALARELSIPLVATQDSHYCSPEDAQAHDILQRADRAEEVEGLGGPELVAQLFGEPPLDEPAKHVTAGSRMRVGPWIAEPVLRVMRGSSGSHEWSRRRVA